MTVYCMACLVAETRMRAADGPTIILEGITHATYTDVQGHGGAAARGLGALQEGHLQARQNAAEVHTREVRPVTIDCMTCLVRKAQGAPDEGAWKDDAGITHATGFWYHENRYFTLCSMTRDGEIWFAPAKTTWVPR